MQGSRSRIFGNKSGGSGIWNTGYVTASGMGQEAKSATDPDSVDDLSFGDGSDLAFGPVTTTLSSMLVRENTRWARAARATTDSTSRSASVGNSATVSPL